MRGACESYKIHYDIAQAEIEGLQKAKADDVSLAYKLAKTEAIIEFAERLKASLNDVARWSMHGDDNEYFIIGKPFIDNLVKEFTEGEGK